jgi:CBS domain-containing protein
MAAAGPFVSAVLALAFWSLAQFGSNRSWSSEILVIAEYLAKINMVVLVFNLIPAFPLDGGRVFRSMLWGITGNLRRSTRWAALVGQGFAWLLIALGIVLFFGGNVVGGIWFGLIGMFVNNAARSSYQQVLLRQALAGEPVRRFMNTEPIVVAPTLDLRRWVEDYVYRFHRKTFPVATNGQLQGFVTTQALAQVPRSEWELHTIGEFMRQDLQAFTISPDADALDALSRMQRTGLSRLLVAEGNRLVGIVSLKDLLRFLQLKLELEPQ